MKQPGNDKVSYPCCPMDFVHQRTRVTTLLFFQASFHIRRRDYTGMHGHESLFLNGKGRGNRHRKLRHFLRVLYRLRWNIAAIASMPKTMIPSTNSNGLPGLKGATVSGSERNGVMLTPILCE